MPRRTLRGSPDADVLDASDLPPDTSALALLGAGDDRFTGSALDDVAYGEDGNDTLRGGAGADVLHGDAGDDRLDGGEGDDRILGGIGADRLLGGAGGDRILGNDGADTLDGGDGDDILRAGDGSDLLLGRIGNDRLVGEAGDDQASGGAGSDSIAGGDGNDTASGGEGADRLLGDDGNDVLDGGAGADALFGEAGDDLLLHAVAPAATLDVVDGGEGNDTLLLAFTRADWFDAANQSELARVAAAVAAGDPVRSARFGAIIADVELVLAEVDGVRVTGADDPVTARNDLLAVTAGASASLDLLLNDTVPDLVAGAQLLDILPNLGMATLTAAGVLTFDTGEAFRYLGAGLTVDVAVGYRVRDADGDVGTAVATVRVTGVNDAPTGVALSGTRVTEGTAPEGGTFIGGLTALDPDGGDSADYTVNDPRFFISGNALFLREGETLDAGTEPSIALTLTVTDSAGVSASSDVTLTVREPAPGFDVQTVGTYEFTEGAGIALLDAAVTRAGLTPVSLATLSAAELATVDAVFATNNYGSPSEFAGAEPQLDAWIRDGGVLFLHDRRVAPNTATFLPGGDGLALNASSGVQVEVVDDRGPLATGPFGTVTDTSLDNGTASTHGWAAAASLPEDAVILLTDGVATHAVTFAYRLGEGAVVYSTIPLDYYLEGSVTPVYAAMRTYGSNLLAAFTDGGDIFG